MTTPCSGDFEPGPEGIVAVKEIKNTAMAPGIYLIRTGYVGTLMSWSKSIMALQKSQGTGASSAV
jgi:hypothetical protein